MKAKLVSESIKLTSLRIRVVLVSFFLTLALVDWTAPRKRAYVGIGGIVAILALNLFFNRLFLRAKRQEAFPLGEKEPWWISWWRRMI